MIAIEMSAMSAFLKAREIMHARGLDSFAAASEIALNSSTESSRHDYIAASKINEIVKDDLEVLIWDKALREILKATILLGDYSWKGSFKFGRKYVIDSLSINERQVFRSAGLLNDDYHEEIVAWWDEIQVAVGVPQQDFDFREWERRTFELEMELLSKHGCPMPPEWESINDNMAGFDILSYRERNGNWEEVFIEVKSSSTGLKRFFLSDREAAKLESRPSNYFIHFWDTKSEVQTVYMGEELIQHLPKNQGLGTWKSALFNL